MFSPTTNTLEIEGDADKAGSCILRTVLSLLHSPSMKNNGRISRIFAVIMLYFSLVFQV